MNFSYFYCYDNRELNLKSILIDCIQRHDGKLQWSRLQTITHCSGLHRYWNWWWPCARLEFIIIMWPCARLGMMPISIISSFVHLNYYYYYCFIIRYIILFCNCFRDIFVWQTYCVRIIMNYYDRWTINHLNVRCTYVQVQVYT